jgi:pimeloyl-ACP methyl ester carboxylesterase
MHRFERGLREYEVLPATPHMQTLEQPHLVAEALGRFLPKEPRQ